MNELGKKVLPIIGAYLMIGLIIALVQNFSGSPCNSLLGEKHAVRRANFIFGVAMWLPDSVRYVWSENMPLREYLAPTRCVSN